MIFVYFKFLRTHLYQIIGVKSLSEDLRCLLNVGGRPVVVEIESLITNNVVVIGHLD